MKINTLRQRIKRGWRGQQLISTKKHNKWSATGHIRGFCGVEGCESEERVVGTELCRSHENRLKKYGSVAGSRRVLRDEPEYSVWKNIKYHKNDVPVSWGTYDEFLKSLGKKPNPSDVLCRKDWAVGYSDENCYWGTITESRHGELYEYNGEKKSVSQWASKSGVPATTIYYRLRSGWDLQKILGDNV